MTDLRVTDHAVLRWIERRYGIDVERERLLIEKAAKPYVPMHRGVIKTDGLQLVLRANAVVTVLKSGMGSVSSARGHL